MLIIYPFVSHVTGFHIVLWYQLNRNIISVILEKKFNILNIDGISFLNPRMVCYSLQTM